MAEEAGGAEGAEEAKPQKKLDLGLIVSGVGLLATLGALGTMVYTKILYKRPPIVESEELAKIKEEVEEEEDTDEERVIVPFDQMVINIAMTSGKAHYATVAMAVECRDEEVSEAVKAKKAQILDKLISTMGRRQMTELSTIQGKLLLKTELMREFSKLTIEAGITDVLFPTFILQ